MYSDVLQLHRDSVALSVDSVVNSGCSGFKKNHFQPSTFYRQSICKCLDRTQYIYTKAAPLSKSG